jgi:hypothetical protein
MQLRASMNLPTMRRNSLTMRGNLSSTRPHLVLRGVHHGLDAEQAFAFGIDLERQSAASNLKIFRSY